ncbi:MAG TPA: hypothetical protein VNA32_00665, partial [Actinomycetota bacterium]|nr:hypothetical protein [Actinomycetota bacterium]
MSQVTEAITEPQLGAGIEVSAAVVGRSPWELFWRRFRKDKVALVGLGFIVLLIVLAVTAPLIARFVVHHGPNELNQDLTNEIGLPGVGPSGNYWFGVDTLGRDVFVRTIYGARTSLTVAFL